LAPCVWIGRGFGDFLDLREKIFFLKPEYLKAPQIEFFFERQMSLFHKTSHLIRKKI
jgi:hypothetical protein